MTTPRTIQATVQSVQDNGAIVEIRVRRNSAREFLYTWIVPKCYGFKRGDKLSVYRKANNPYLYFAGFAE